ncbi:MAG: hypothetical protein ACYTEQ_30730 [Planctomycetota bacterium]|jgi:hypothetical protein
MPKLLTPLKAIRAKCLDCCCKQVKEIRECPIVDCALWPYRMGRRPSADTVRAHEEYDDSWR